MEHGTEPCIGSFAYFPPFNETYSFIFIRAKHTRPYERVSLEEWKGWIIKPIAGELNPDWLPRITTNHTLLSHRYAQILQKNLAYFLKL